MLKPVLVAYLALLVWYTSAESDAEAVEKAQSRSIPCYNSRGEAQRCVPMFENAAYKKMVGLTNLCSIFALQFGLKLHTSIVIISNNIF